MGMSYDEFWVGEPSLAIAFRKADAIRRRRKNEELWLAGVYTAHALEATVVNMFTKGTKAQYPSEPIAITAEEVEERKERERRVKIEKMKAAFTAKALKMNAYLGGKTANDEH